MAIKAKEVSYERQYKAGQMSTAVFPFALDATQLDDFFGVEKVHKFKSIDVENQTLTFEDKTSTTANEPFMFKPIKAGKIAFAAEGDGYIDISNTLDETTKEPLTIATSGQNANGGTATFQGIYEQKIWGADYIINEDNNPVYMFNAAKESGQFSILAKKQASTLQTIPCIHGSDERCRESAQHDKTVGLQSHLHRWQRQRGDGHQRHR
jgi:hypothetical protein